MDSWRNNLELLIKSRTPLIWITTKEEERLTRILKKSCAKLNVSQRSSFKLKNFDNVLAI